MALQTIKIRTGRNTEQYGPRYVARAYPPWNTFASGEIVAYGERTPEDAATQLRLMLMDLGGVLGMRYEFMVEEDAWRG